MGDQFIRPSYYDYGTMTEKEFYAWLRTCPTDDWLVVHSDDGLRTVNFIVDNEPS